MDFQGFEEVDHTADLALRVWGEDFQTLLIQAARGLYDLLNVNTLGGSRVSQTFTIKEDQREAMLVDFLNELLFLCEDKQKSFYSFNFIADRDGLMVEAQGEQVVSLGRTIKAVTFHDLNIVCEDEGLETILTFDV